MILATDGITSYAFFIYGRIDWTSSNGQHAEAGFYFANGRQHSLIHSGTDSMRELVQLVASNFVPKIFNENNHFGELKRILMIYRKARKFSLSNNQREGSQIFRISGSTPEDPRGASGIDDYQYSDYNERDYDEDEGNDRQHRKSYHCDNKSFSANL